MNKYDNNTIRFKLTQKDRRLLKKKEFIEHGYKLFFVELYEFFKNNDVKLYIKKYV